MWVWLYSHNFAWGIWVGFRGGRGMTGRAGFARGVEPRVDSDTRREG